MFRCRSFANAAFCTVLLAMSGVFSPLRAAEQGYALGRVAVLEGLPVAGVQDGIVFAQTLDSDCGAVPQALDARDLPLAGALSSPLELGVSILGCRTSVAPEVNCSWEIRPLRSVDGSCGEPRACGAVDPGSAKKSASCSGHAAWQGWVGEFPVTVPKETGVYNFTLTCAIVGETPEVVERPLYVTYAKPLEVFSPPEPAWYERASCWGAGFDSDASESKVLEGLLAGMYRYGQENWRYGYATGKGSNRYDFLLFREAAGESRIGLELNEEDLIECSSPSYCKCDWQALVANDPVCDFADCYVWSEVYQAIAAVAGIGGLEPVVISGLLGIGFVVKPDTKSFDYDFPNNVSCAPSAAVCFPYHFSSHSLRARSGVIGPKTDGFLYYDATFDGIYADKNEPIALDSKENNGEKVTFLESDHELTKIEQGYGNWNFWNGGSSALIPATVGPAGIEFTGKVEYSAVPLFDGGGPPYSSLKANVSVRILRAGEYLVDGRLYSSPEGDPPSVLIADRPSATAAGPTLALAAGHPGDVVIVELDFSGAEIRDAGIDGHYEGRFFSGGKTLQVETPESYVANDFSESSVAFVRPEPAAGADAADGIPIIRFEYSEGATKRIKIDVQIDVYTAGTVGLEGRLADARGGTLSYSGATRVFQSPTNSCGEGGAGCLELDFAIKRSEAREHPAPFVLTLVLFDDTLTALDSYSRQFEDLTAAAFE